MCFKDTGYCWQRDLLDIIENVMIIDYVGLNFYKSDCIIGQNEVYDIFFLLLCEYGAPPYFVFSTFNPMLAKQNTCSLL